METNRKIVDNLKDTNQWLRVLYMILFAVVLYVVIAVLYLLSVVQVFFALLTGEPNKNLMNFGGKLSQYIGQMTDFLSYKTEYKPFPFTAWGESADSETVVSAPATEAGSVIETAAEVEAETEDPSAPIPPPYT